MKLTLRDMFYTSVGKYADRPALSFVSDDKPMTYQEMHDKVQQVKYFLIKKLGLKKGDKVALWAENMPNWGVTYMAITGSALIAVPILPDFSPFEVSNILEHSEADIVFVSKRLLPKLKEVKAKISTVVLIDDFVEIKDKTLFSREKEVPILDEHMSPAEEYPLDEDDLAVIIYTSGTTGKSKGVMLTHKNITSNTVDIKAVQEVEPNDVFLSILPLSHTYENTVGFLLPIHKGASIVYLEKPPTASVLLPALRKVRPTFMLSVPLIIEKIYRKNVLPSITGKGITNSIYKTGLGRKALNRIAGKKLKDIFGGKLKFFGVGGAKLDPEVEKFLREAKFPYAVGYGLTETSPLLAGGNPRNIRFQSCGLPMPGVDVKINNPDPKTGEGEIIAKGTYIMKGYYKEPELTKAAFTEDGYYRTGDLGVFDKDGFLYIKGRLKNMILGPSGENIYPEEIEAIINSFDHVNESIVVEREGRLVALVNFDFEELEKKAEEWVRVQYQKASDLAKDTGDNLKDKYDAVNLYVNHLTKQLRDYVNQRVNKSARIQAVEVHKEPFVKTATKKIKRYLYTKQHNEQK